MQAELKISADSLKGMDKTTVFELLNRALLHCEIEPIEALGIANECGLYVNVQLVQV